MGPGKKERLLRTKRPTGEIPVGRFIALLFFYPMVAVVSVDIYAHSATEIER